MIDIGKSDAESAEPQNGSQPEELIHSRRYARELVMQTLYATTMSGGDFPFLRRQIIDSDERIDKDNKEFAVALAIQADECEKRCDTIITGVSKNWDIKRLAVIDRAILRVALTEFLYFSDIPPKVTIDEALEIAKRYSTDESAKFINGILDAVLKDMKEKHTLHKSGRGRKDT